MRLQSTHFQTKEVDTPPSPKYVIPSFRKTRPLQEPTIIAPPSPVRESLTSHEPTEPITIRLFLGGLVVWTSDGKNTKFWESESKPTRIPCEELQFAKENKEEATKPKEEDPTLLSKEPPSFVEEEEEDNKFIPPLEEQVMAFEPLLVNEDLLLGKEEDYLLQQTTLYDVEHEKEGLKDSFFLEEGYANLHEVSPQPMHVFATVMEEISDEDDLLDELDALYSSIDIESISPIYEEHVLQHQQVGDQTIPIDLKEVVHGQHEQDVEKNQEEEPLPNQLKTTIAEHNQVLKDDSSGPTPSRGCPIRYLALQQINKLPPVIFTPEHEEDYHKEEQVCFSPQGNTPMLESFTIFSIGRKVFHVAVCLSYLLIHLAVLLHGTRNWLIRKGSYFNKLVNGFV